MLFSVFSVFGPVESIRICRDKTTHKSLGYAYVNYIQPEDAERALDKLNHEMLDGRNMKIMWMESPKLNLCLEE